MWMICAREKQKMFHVVVIDQIKFKFVVKYKDSLNFFFYISLDVKQISDKIIIS